MIKVSAGLSRKVGEANYSSRGRRPHAGTRSIPQMAWGGISQVGRPSRLSAQGGGKLGPEQWNLAKVQAIPKGLHIPVVLQGVRINMNESGCLFGRETKAMKLTAVFMQVPEGYIGFVEEILGANSQGNTLEEARALLTEAVNLVLEANRELSALSLVGKEVAREPFELAAS